MSYSGSNSLSGPQIALEVQATGSINTQLRPFPVSPTNIGLSPQAAIEVLESKQSQISSTLREVMVKFVADQDAKFIQQQKYQSKWATLKQRPTKELVAGATGIASGVLCTAVAVPLAADFGEWVASLMAKGDNKGLQQAFRYFFGVTAPIPITFMAATASAKMFSSAVTPDPEWKTAVKTYKGCKCKPARIIYASSSWLMSILCSITEAGVTVIKLKKQMGAWVAVFAIPDFISSVMLYKSFMDHVAEPLVDELEEKYLANAQCKQIIQELFAKLEAAKKVISQLSSRDSNELLKKLFQSHSISQHEEAKLNDRTTLPIAQALYRIALFLAIGDNFQPQEQKCCRDVGKKAITGIATATATISTFSFWKFGTDTVATLGNTVGWARDKTQDALGYLVGASSITARAAMSIVGSITVFPIIVDFVNSMPAKCKAACAPRKEHTLLEEEQPERQDTEECCTWSNCGQYALQTLSWIVSLASTATISEMFKESTDSDSIGARILIASTYLANLAVRYMAVRNFIESMKDLKTTPTDKEFLLQEISNIKEFIKQLPPEFLVEFSKVVEVIIKAAAEHRETVPANPSVTV